MAQRTTSEPLEGEQKLRRHLGVRGELMLAILPTATVLLVMGFVEVLSTQRLLFASLASSAFLIYLDPTHATNQVRTLLIAQMSAAVIGWAVHAVAGPGYLGAGIAMVVTIIVTISSDAVHPPAVATAMSFGLRAGEIGDLALFALALAILCVLVVMQRTAVWLMARLSRPREYRPGGTGAPRGS